MTGILTARALRKSYGPVEVLHDVSLTLEKGEAHVVIGPNGAGKTTLFKCLSGETRVNGGEIRLEGRDATRSPDWRRVRGGVGRTFQVARIFPEMTVRENLIVAAEMRERIERGILPGLLRLAPGPEARREADAMLDELALTPRAEDEASILSHGDKKRLELAMALALRPRILMLDEPTAGMSPSDRADAVRLIRDVRARHDLTLLLTEHDMDVVFGLADRLTVLHHGAIIASGEPEAVRADARVKEVYLGHA
jgi:branched-chain amino acid transport system ATP-binding protein